jgi:hypothetical protein
MSAIRRRFRIAWDDGDPVEVRTNAWDMSAAQDHQNDPVRATFALVHNALLRSDVDLPPLDQFIGLVDELTDLEPDSEGEPTNGQSVELDPTQLVHGRSVPSRLPS